jgi:hypothetical protein
VPHCPFFGPLGTTSAKSMGYVREIHPLGAAGPSPHEPAQSPKLPIEISPTSDPLVRLRSFSVRARSLNAYSLNERWPNSRADRQGRKARKYGKVSGKFPEVAVGKLRKPVERTPSGRTSATTLSNPLCRIPIDTDSPDAYRLLIAGWGVGCASSSDAIKPAYVSPLQYQNLTCQQIGAEM